MMHRLSKREFRNEKNVSLGTSRRAVSLNFPKLCGHFVSIKQPAVKCSGLWFLRRILGIANPQLADGHPLRRDDRFGNIQHLSLLVSCYRLLPSDVVMSWPF